MSTPHYSLENLRALMATSPAYQALDDGQKAAIEQHIAENNRPMLLYIFHHLQLEANVHEQARQQLAGKIIHAATTAARDAEPGLKKLAKDLKNMVK